jgi:dihydroxyacetone kinase-like predicted kinase
VVGDQTALHVHVHMADPGPAFSAGIALGGLHRIKVDNMQAQHEEWAAGHEAASESTPEVLPALGLVAVATGPGIAAAFRDLGAVALSPDGGKPSAGAFLEAARRAGEQHVFLLPNDKDAVLAAEAAATEAPEFITVVQARTVAAGLSAAVAYLPEGKPEDVARAMRAAMEDVRCVEVTHAVRSGRIEGVEVAAGDAIALLDGTLVARGDTLEDALLAGLSKAVAPSSELVTVYLGAEAPKEAAGRVLAMVEGAHPHVSVEVADGGQPHYPYVVAVE